jgi:vanillate O-demethylase monooxygenase subunit
MPIALFRRIDGRVSAIADQCAHRRMKLSGGRVEGDQLICPYHGWSYGGEGEGQSPSTPRLHACIDSYDCDEASGVVWIRGRHADALLKAPAVENMKFTGAVFSTVRAPLEIVIDNFSEGEHTVSMHPDFGFDRHCAGEATVVLETSDESVAVRSHGPAKMATRDDRPRLIEYRPRPSSRSDF